MMKGFLEGFTLHKRMFASIIERARCSVACDADALARCPNILCHLCDAASFIFGVYMTMAFR